MATCHDGPCQMQVSELDFGSQELPVKVVTVLTFGDPRLGYRGLGGMKGREGWVKRQVVRGPIGRDRNLGGIRWYCRK